MIQEPRIFSMRVFIMLSLTELSVLDFARGAGAREVPTPAMMVETLRDVSRLQQSALVIGGVATIYHGYRRSTAAVDLLYSSSDKDAPERFRMRFKLRKYESAGGICCNIGQQVFI
jgi:hypothetical protein